MKLLARLLHAECKHSSFHISALSCFMLGFFIAFTASEMGAFAPLLICLGVYLGIFALLIETIFWMFALMRRATVRWVSE